MTDVRVRPAGDAALIAALPPSLDVETSTTIVAVAEAVARQCGAVLRDAVIGVHTLTVYFDPLTVDPRWLEDEIRHIASAIEPGDAVAGPLIDVPVCYGGAFGPDLAAVAAAIGCSEQHVIDLHCGTEYRVYVVGFVPGFAYMGILPAPLDRLPRRSSPRTLVPERSVAIAAGQTGIYPMETPGGWHLLGRTPIRPFDPSRPAPVLFRVGDRVRFHPIDQAAYDGMAG